MLCGGGAFGKNSMSCSSRRYFFWEEGRAITKEIGAGTITPWRALDEKVFAINAWKLNRKLVHISIGLLFMLCWPLFSSGYRGAILAAVTPGINIIRMFLVGSGIWKDEATVKSMSRYGDYKNFLKNHSIILQQLLWLVHFTGVLHQLQLLQYATFVLEMHAVVFVDGDQYYGAKASLNMWAPDLTNEYDFSFSQIWIISGSFGNDLNTIEAGWQVSPELYGDKYPRFFTYWTTDAYQATGCYNLLCSGYMPITALIMNEVVTNDSEALLRTTGLRNDIVPSDSSSISSIRGGATPEDF
ncbi:uncharacterized protein LOC120214703 [Hibiscus syriacus]|uniref:uncharacterized protein LOC120214703 n=1 Tax=Hibiscus syriacus TaxID=106335 RepID=UPI0019245F47|nr:uncharacterized protein LOC120214703 [Hibiscus syriacus]